MLGKLRVTSTIMVLWLIIAATVSAQPFTLRHIFDDPTPTPPLDDPVGGDHFGLAAALDGNRVLIGAPLDSTYLRHAGQAHLFDVNTGNLLRTFDDPHLSDGNRDRFGYAVALNGNKVAIGEQYSRQVYLFDATTGDELRTFDDPTPTGGNLEGIYPAIAMDGNHILIGDHSDDTHGQDIGQAHLFDVTTGDLLHTFNDPTITTRDFFGRTVAIDGNHVLIGAYFDDTNGENVGQAHLFDVTTGDLLHTFNDPTITTEDRFGRRVAIDGNHVLIGANGDDTNGENVGQAHLFDVTTGDLLRTFNDPTITTNDNFGRRVAIDGNHVLIGAYLDDTNGENVGQAHLFNLSTGDLVQTFDDPTITEFDTFGRSVALDGNRVLIAAPSDDTYGERVGQAYLFTAVADFNGDGQVDCVDVDSLVAEIVAGTHGSSFDLTADELVNNDDLDEWLVQAGAVNLPSGNPYLVGDATLDGTVDGLDFIAWNNHKFTSTTAWCSGDFNADGLVDGLDFVLWNDNKYTSSDGGVAAVPEPGISLGSIIALLTLGNWRIRRREQQP